MWILRSSNDNTERILRITPGSPRTVGRGPRSDFVLSGALISRIHCRLLITNNELTVEDMNSTNGTFVNDQRISQSQLNSGDRLRLGRLELIVSEE